MTPGALGTRVERALKWSALTTVARFALQLGAQVALARMLGPGNFGVYGIGMAVLTFVAFLSGASFSWSLMLAPSVSRDDIRFSFTWQMIAGLLSAAAMYLAAPAIAGFFGDPLIEGRGALAGARQPADGSGRARHLPAAARPELPRAGPDPARQLCRGLPRRRHSDGAWRSRRQFAGGRVRGAGCSEPGRVLCGQAPSRAAVVFARRRRAGADDRPHGVPDQRGELALGQSRSRRARPGAQHARGGLVFAGIQPRADSQRAADRRAATRPSWRRAPSFRTIRGGWPRAGCWDWPACWCC